MSNISYRGKNYDAALLVVIAGQGVAIEIDAGQIAFVDSYALLDANKAKPVLVVAKNGNAYDLLAATYDKLVSPDGLRIQGKVKVILMSKHVLAKAEVSAVQERLRSAAQSERDAMTDQDYRRPMRLGFQGSGLSYSQRRTARY